MKISDGRYITTKTDGEERATKTCTLFIHVTITKFTSPDPLQS